MKICKQMPKDAGVGGRNKPGSKSPVFDNSPNQGVSIRKPVRSGSNSGTKK